MAEFKSHHRLKDANQSITIDSQSLRLLTAVDKFCHQVSSYEPKQSGPNSACVSLSPLLEINVRRNLLQ